MNNTLFAIYVVAVWHVHHDPNIVRRHEFVIPHHVDCAGPSYCDAEPPQLFHTRAVCERYREQLITKWIARPQWEVPLQQKNIISSRCGVWPNIDAGEKI